MGNDGKPTEIDFTKQFVLAIVLPVTNLATEITPDRLEEKGDTLLFTLRRKIIREPYQFGGRTIFSTS